MRQRILLFLAACCVSVIATSALAQGKKGGGGSTPPPPPPPVQYTVVWLGMLEGYDYSNALAANSHGEIVGVSMAGALSTRVATRFTATGPVNLNEEFADLLAARSDGPWRAWIAWGINELGQITGNITQGLGSHPFIYTPGGDGGLPRELRILPQMRGGATWSEGINNFGEICGLYAADGGGTFVAAPGGPLIDMGPLGINGGHGTIINDAGQIAFYSGRYTPNLVLGDAGTFESFPGWLTAINAQGDVAGAYSTTTTKGKTKTTFAIYRAASPAALETIYQGSSAAFPLINDQRDVCFLADNRITLFRDGIGLIRIDTTIAPADAKWSMALSTVANALLNPDPTSDTSFPVIAGKADLGGVGSPEEAFLLIPSAAP